MHGGDVWRAGAPGDWLDFSANIRPGGPPDWVREALLAGMGDVSYYPDLRMERARSALGEYLNLGADWVLPTAGGISAIALAMRLDAPEVIVFGPCFGEYAEIAADCGAKVRELSLLKGREVTPETTPSAAPTSASRKDREPGALSAMPCEATLFAAQTSAPREGHEPGELSVMPCEETSSAAPASALRKDCESGELPEALCGGMPAGLPTSASREGHEPGELSEVSREGAPPVAPKSIPLAISRESASLKALREHCELGAQPVVSANMPREGCESDESPAILRESASSVSSLLEHGAADAPSPKQRGRHALAMPSEVLRGNMTPGAAVWLCNPLNPVGIAHSREEIEALLRIVESAGGWLVLDEAFVHCCPERTSVDLLAGHPRLVIAGSLTKSLGIPGARAGYICANPELLRKLARRQRSWELNCFAESVIRALPGHAAELHAEAALNAARRETLRRGLEALDAYVYPSEACFLLADFGRDVSPVVERLREKSILVRQCADFHGIDDGCHLRLAVKDEAANARLIEALREALHRG